MRIPAHLPNRRPKLRQNDEVKGKTRDRLAAERDTLRASAACGWVNACFWAFGSAYGIKMTP